MPDYRITDPDSGDVVVITGDRQPTRREALKAFGMMRQQRSEQQVAGMTGDDLSEVVYGNPAVEYPDHVLRKLYDHEQTRSTDWWKVAKGLPGAAGRAVKDLAVNTGKAAFQETPQLIGQAFNDPAKAAGTAANTFAEFGARQVEEVKMLPPVYAARLDMLNRKIKSFDDYHSKSLAEYKRDRDKRYQARTLRERPVDVTGKVNVEQENPTLYKQLKKDYDQFRADEQFKNWKQIFHERQADSLKAAEVQSGKTSYVAEAAGGKEALEALTGSSEVMGSGAQVATDLFGLDILSAAPIGKIGGKALGTTGKFDNLATRAGKAATGKLDKAAAGAERVGKAVADAAGDNVVLRLSLSTPAAAAITASQFADTLARLAEVAAGGSVSRAARKARTRSARGILGASDNAFIEGMLQRVGQGLDEAIPAAGRGAAIGTLMGLGAVNDQQLAESIGGQAGFGGALGGVTGGGLGFTKIQQFNKANELLAKMDPDVREDFLASRLTALQGEANPQAAFIDELAAISYINEDLAPDGVRVTVATPEQIVKMMRDQGRDEAFAVDAAQQQGVTFQNPVNNQTMVVVNSEYAQHMGKTAIHEVFHSFDHHDGEVDKNGIVDRIKAAWNEETPETGTLKGERIRLMTEAFGLFDETGRQLAEGVLTQQQGEDAIDAYLSRRHGGDQSKVRADKTIDGRPMTYQELVNAYGDEVFARISEDFGTGNPIKNIRPGMIFSAVRNRLSRLREYVLRATGGKTDVAQVDALEKAAGNPMLQAIAREFWRTRKALKTATFRDSSKLTAAVTPKKLTRGKNAVANVNRYAGTGMFRTNADGKVLAENGEVFSAKPGERVAIIPQAERNKMAKRAVEAINSTLESLGEQDDGMFPSESKTGKPFWVGIPNEAQLAAILALPDSTVPRILKQRIEKVVKAAREGDTLGVDHSKALTGRKYDTLAEMEYRLVAPFGFRISQAGNFLAMLFDIGKLNEKVDTRFKNKPKWFSEWADDTDPTGREGFYRTLREALERQRQGIKNNGDNTVGYDKILQLLNIDRLDADVGGSPTGLIRSFRVDRMNEIQTAEPKGFRIDYSRYKNPATFKPNPQEVKAQPSDADYMNAIESGDMEMAQRMVDQAAKAAGYDPKTLYHNTNATIEELSKGFSLPAFFTPDVRLFTKKGKNKIRVYVKRGKEFQPMLWEKVPPELNAQVRKRQSKFDTVTNDAGLVVRIDGKPSQIKLADPVTRDDNGNVIPLSERFNKASDDIRFMPSDADYMRAVGDGDMETAQRMVDQAAKAAGLNTEQSVRGDLLAVKREAEKNIDSIDDSVQFDVERDEDLLEDWSDDDPELKDVFSVFTKKEMFPKNRDGGSEFPYGTIWVKSDGSYDVSMGEHRGNAKSMDAAVSMIKEYIEDEYVTVDASVSEIKEVSDFKSVALDLIDPENWGVDGDLHVAGTGSAYITIGDKRYSIRDHDPSPFREAEFGMINGWQEVNWKNFDEVEQAVNWIAAKLASERRATYDDAGNVIPLSQRFDKASDDIRFQPRNFQPEAPTRKPSEVQGGDDVRFMARASKKDGLTKERRASAVAKEKEIKELNKANPEAVRLELKTDNEGRPKFPKDSDKAEVKQVGYALRKAPGLSSNDEVAVQQAANKLEPVVRKAMKNPEVKKGIGWYQRMRQFLQKNFGANIEIFGQMLGATSAQTPVDTNFIYTLEALRLLSRGEYDDLLADYHKHVTSITGKTELEVFNEWKERNPKKRESEFSYSDEVIRQVNLFKDQPLRANGRRFGANSDQVLQVLYGNWLDQVKGPKTPNFAGNLTGRTLAATIDVWAARTMRRILYQGKIKRWRLHPQQEKGVDYNRKNDGTYTGDFPFAQQVFAEVAERVGMAPDDLQALIWFAEKDVWAKNGWTNEVGAKKSSFDDEAAKLDLERLQAGVTTYTDESRYQQEQQEAERQVLRKTIGSIAGLEVSRVTHSDGLYEGTVEPTLDVEFSAERGTDVRPVVEQVVNMAKDHDQWDAFVSLVVGVDHPNARPSVEIGFQGPASTSQINAVVNAFDANGVKGFTVAKDERGNAIGVRSQYIPEIEGRWGDSTHLDPGAFPENAKAWVMNMQKALAQLDGMENISYVEPGHVSTTVYGKEEYGQAEQADLRRTDASAELGRRVSILGR